MRDMDETRPNSGLCYFCRRYVKHTTYQTGIKDNPKGYYNHKRKFGRALWADHLSAPGECEIVLVCRHPFCTPSRIKELYFASSASWPIVTDHVDYLTAEFRSKSSKRFVTGVTKAGSELDSLRENWLNVR